MEGVGGRKLFACEPSEAPPPARFIEGRDPQKNALILLEEKIGRVQNQKLRRIFFCGARERSERRRGGSFLVRMFVKMGSDFNQKVPPRTNLQSKFYVAVACKFLIYYATLLGR